MRAFAADMSAPALRCVTLKLADEYDKLGDLVASFVAEQRGGPSTVCPNCCMPMKLAQSIPQLGGLRELHHYDCHSCGVGYTVEAPA